MEHSLLIIGPDIESSGIGGVTIHVRRLRDFLEKNGIDYEFKDYKSNSIWTLFSRISRCRIIHIHISNPLYQLVITLLSHLLGKTVIITLHGDYGRFGKLKNGLVRTSLRLADVPIVINEKSFNLCKIIIKKVILIPAFIPPQKEEQLSNDILTLIQKIQDEGKKICSTNASHLSIDKQGNEIYGIGFLVDYFRDLKDKVLLVSDPSGEYERKYHDLQTDSVRFINYPHSYYEVLKRSDYSIRNTSTDGDSLSVKEALYLNIPTLCTDVVDRPDGVRLFKYCDKFSFENSLNQENSRTVTVENGAVRILQIYRDHR